MPDVDLLASRSKNKMDRNSQALVDTLVIPLEEYLTYFLLLQLLFWLQV